MRELSTVYVYADWKGLGGPSLMGQLHRPVVRGEEVLAFEYDLAWLQEGLPFVLDPRLQLVAGRQYGDTSRGKFGLFTDSAPDRWGRLLIQRREALRAEPKGHVLHDSDYLLAVTDRTRMGGLRFKLEPDGPFLAEETALSVPPMQQLRELEQASLALETAQFEDPEYSGWLQMLLAPGTSLGGARPKASVVDPAGILWIAKFPSRQDEYDVGAWEGLAHELAGRAGLQIGPGRTEAFSRTGHSFLCARFDREGQKRIHFSSAMNLLGYQDGDGARTGASYLDLVEFIERNGARVDLDLAELWRRIVFNICIHNTDDHLRNHGFLLGNQGWYLSPAYDLNPQPWPGGLALNVDETSNACDLDLARSVGRYFRLSEKQQDSILREVTTAVGGWEPLAARRGLPRSETERMRSAFAT